MDPVSLTLAILPLVAGAVKAYGKLHKKLKCFCHYSREVYRARKQFDRQRQFFHNEVHLLIRPAVEDESAVELMLSDPSHATWASRELEDALKRHLGPNYNACLDVIEEISSSNKELLELMTCFSEVESRRRKAEPMKDAVRRLRDGIKVAWDKSKIDASITSLRSSNDDLRRLRQQAIELQKPVTQLKDTKKRVAQEYVEYKLIRRASKALHAALSTAWSSRVASCAGDTVRHDVKLFVDAKVKDGVLMNMTVLCFGSHTLHLAQRTMTRLQVKSQLLDWIDSGFNPPPHSDSRRPKRRKVRFFDESAGFLGSGSEDHGSMLPLPERPSILPSQSEDLSGKDLCSTLAEKTVRPTDHCSPVCLGFIDNCSEETFRHSLYHVAGSGRKPQPELTVSMYQIMHHPVESSLSVIDQLKLARNLVTAVLKFHSTPWLGHYFALNDLSIFQSTPDLSTCLQTLHFGAGFITSHCHDMSGSAMDSLDPEGHSTLDAEAVENAKLQYGIRNLTLWCLGTILLQIGRWAAVDSPDDVLTIRKLSSQAVTLGPRYQALTKRCLECDFGYGEDLSKPRLQQALHENVVCELSDMISSLDING